MSKIPSSPSRRSSTGESENQSESEANNTQTCPPSPFSPPPPVEQSASGRRSRKRSHIKEERLAECEKCKRKGTDLVKCFQCKHVFGSNVKVIDNPFLPDESRVSKMKYEPSANDGLEGCSSPTATFHSEESPISNLHSKRVRGDSIDAREPSVCVQIYEKRLRVIQASKDSRSMIFHISKNSKENKTVFQAQTNTEDTIIEEMRALDLPNTIRTIQITDFGAQIILMDEIYKSNLQKIIFGCPSSLDFMLTMLSYTLKLKTVRFGVHAFNLGNQDGQKLTIEVGTIECKELESLEMAFDSSIYHECDAESKERMRGKIAAVLQVASSSFPKLKNCDITVPEDMEPELDLFLGQKVDIKRKGCKTHNYKDNTVRFYIDRHSNKSKEKDKECTDPQPYSSHSAIKGTTTEQVVIIEISDDDEDGIAEIPSSKITLNKSKVGNRQPLETFVVDWNDGTDDHEILINGYVADCSNCEHRSRNMMECDKCGQTFPSQTRRYRFDRVPQSRASTSSQDPVFHWSQDEEVGDSTTSVILLAGETLDLAQPFLNQKMHPTVIIRAYRQALEDMINVLQDDIAIPIDLTKDEQVREVIKACIGKKFMSQWSDLAVNIAEQAVKTVYMEENGRKVIDIKRYVKVEKIPGGRIEDSYVLKGIMLNKDVTHQQMRRKIEKPRVLLLDCPLEYKKGESMTNVEMFKDFTKMLQQEEEFVEKLCEDIVRFKPDLIFTEKGVSDLAQHFLVKAGITAIRRVKKSDNNRLSQATGATIVSRTDELREEDIGTRCGLFEVKKIGDENVCFMSDCADPKACTIVLRGASRDIVKEVERNLQDAMRVARNIFLDPKVVAGGGAVEMAVAHALTEKSKSMTGVERWPYRAVVQALEVIPRTLAQNCGANVIRTLTTLRAKHAAGGKTWGINGETGEVVDMSEFKIWKPLSVKLQVYKTAIETAILLLRIDDIVSGFKKRDRDGQGGQGVGTLLILQQLNLSTEITQLSEQSMQD